MHIFNLLFSFHGRLIRSKFWLAVLIYLIATVVIVGFLFVPVAGVVIAAIGYIAMLISGIAVGLKRLHDRNKGGWWLLLFYGVPMGAEVLQTAMDQIMDEPPDMLILLLSLVSAVIGIWGFVELGCLRGTIGNNVYGPDPLPPPPAPPPAQPTVAPAS